MKKKLFTVLIFTFLCCFMNNNAFAQEEGLFTYTEPYLLTLHPDEEMNVCWLTKDNAECIVEYGETTELGKKVNCNEYEIKGMKKSAYPDKYDQDPAKNPDIKVMQQIGKLTDLKPGTCYYYRVITKSKGKEQVSKIYNFNTAPSVGTNYSFILLSDLQLKSQVPDTLKLAGQSKPDFIIYNGDLANSPWKAAEWFKLEESFMPEAERGKSWFEMMQQNTDGCELLQYTPIYPCPGNHEVDDQRNLSDKSFATNLDGWTLRIYMELFRPLYPEQEYGRGGKHWYSVDYSDMHIASISVFRWHPWNGFTAPGWMMYDDISPNSDQVKWLENDLKNAVGKYKWVTMHWHMLNRGEDGYIPVSNPVLDARDSSKVIYPNGDYCYDVLKPTYEKCGVNAVSYGHSHVYERYNINKVNYIEAASIGNDYRKENDPYHPSGNKPIFEENSFRSFMYITRDGNGLHGKGIQASVEEGGKGAIGRVFDRLTIAVPLQKYFFSLLNIER